EGVVTLEPSFLRRRKFRIYWIVPKATVGKINDPKTGLLDVLAQVKSARIIERQGRIFSFTTVHDVSQQVWVGISRNHEDGFISQTSNVVAGAGKTERKIDRQVRRKIGKP